MSQRMGPEQAGALPEGTEQNRTESPSMFLFVGSSDTPVRSYRVFTARRNARIASAVLAITIPFVCLSVRPSVTRRYCVKTTARSTVQLPLSDSKMCLVL